MSERDNFTCVHCGKTNCVKGPYMYPPRLVKQDKPIQVIDTWNIPYSTGLYILSKDEIPKEEVEQFATANAHFPFWPLRYMGKLWAKETWDD